MERFVAFCAVPVAACAGFCLSSCADTVNVAASEIHGSDTFTSDAAADAETVDLDKEVSCPAPSAPGTFGLSCAPAAAANSVPPEPHTPGTLLSFPGDLSAATQSPPAIASVATAPGGARSYIGRRWVDDARALTIVTHATDGRVIDQRDVAIGGPLAPGETRGVVQVVLDAPRQRLHTLVLTDVGDGTSRDAAVVTLILDETGFPTGLTNQLPLDVAYALPAALALHPDGRHAYLVGASDADIIALDIDAAGNLGTDLRRHSLGNGSGKVALSVHPAGQRLFVASTELEILTLTDGVPTAVESTLAWPAPTRVVYADPNMDYFNGQMNVVVTPRAVFRQQTVRPTAGGTGWPIQSWQLDYALLDPDGRLVDGVVQTRADLTHSWLAATPDALVLASPETRDGTFVGTRMKRVGLTDGVPDAEATHLEPFLAKSAVWQFAASDDGTLAIPTDLLSFWSDLPAIADPVGHVRIRLQVSATPPEGGPGFGPGSVGITVPRYNASASSSLALSGYDEILTLELDPYLANYPHSRAVQVMLEGNICASDASIQATLEYEDMILGEMHSETLSTGVSGCYLAVFVDGNAVAYAGDKPRLRTYAGQLETYAPFLDSTLGAVQPVEFPVSCSVNVGAGGGKDDFESSLALLEGVGCNLIQTSNSPFSFSMLPAEMHARMDAHGFVRRETGAYAPNDAYFSFDPKLGSEALATWAERDVLKYIDDMGGTRDRLLFVTLADEPAWYFPDTYALAESGAGHDAFIALLQEQGFAPVDLGAESWDEVVPISQADATDLPHRRLYYWSQRFFSQAASDGMAAARKALETAAGHALLTPVNFNNWETWMWPSPNRAIGGAEIINDDTGMGSFDWFYSGRTSAHTLFSEDWTLDFDLHEWIFRAQNLRSAASLGDQVFGSYVIAGMSAEIPDAVSMRALSLVGRGAKLLDYFSFGPDGLFPGNCWSERREVYPQLQQANRRVRFADHIFATGVADAPDVAIMSPQDAPVWAKWGAEDPSVHTLSSNEDARGVSLMLAHAGRDAHVFDDRAIAEGLLAARGIKALYVSAPNVSASALAAIQSFVNGGGTLVLGPGAGERDEYDTPSTGFEGLAEGCGHIERTATLMGRDYLLAGHAAHRTRLRDGYPSALRDTMVGWLGAQSTRAVQVDAPMVEVLRINAGAESAIVLLNWDPEANRCVTVRVPGGAGFGSVTSSEEGPLTVERHEADLEIQLTLARVAVLKLTPE